MLILDTSIAAHALTQLVQARPPLGPPSVPDLGDTCTEAIRCTCTEAIAIAIAVQAPLQPCVHPHGAVDDATDAAVFLTPLYDSPFTTGNLLRSTSGPHAVTPGPSNACAAATPSHADFCRAGAERDLRCTGGTSAEDDCAVAAPLFRLPGALQLPLSQGASQEGIAPADAELPEPTLGWARPIVLCPDVDAEAWVVPEPRCQQAGAAGGWEPWGMPAPSVQRQHQGGEEVDQVQQQGGRRAKGFQRLLQQLQLQEGGGRPCGGPGAGPCLSPAEPCSVSDDQRPADNAAASWLAVAAAAVAGPEGGLFVGPTMLSEAEAGAGDSTDRMAGGARKAAGLHQLLRPWLRSRSHSARTVGSGSSTAASGLSGSGVSLAWSGGSYSSRAAAVEGAGSASRGGSPVRLSAAGEARARPLRPRLVSLPAPGTPLSLPMYGMTPSSWMPDGETECDITFGPVHGLGEGPSPCQNTASAVPAASGAAAPPTSLERYATLMSTSAQWRYGTLYDKHDAMMLSRLSRIASFTGGARVGGGGGGRHPGGGGNGDGDGGASGGCAAAPGFALGHQHQQQEQQQQHHQLPRPRGLSRFGSVSFAATGRLSDLGSGAEQGHAADEGAGEDPAAHAPAPRLQSAPGEPRGMPPPELPTRGQSAPDGSQQATRRRAPPKRSHTGLQPAALRSRAPGRSLMGAEAMQALSQRRPSTQVLLQSAFGQQLQQQQPPQAGAFRRTRHASLLAYDGAQRAAEARGRTSTASLLSLPLPLLPPAGHQNPCAGGGGGVGWGEKLEVGQSATHTVNEGLRPAWPPRSF